MEESSIFAATLGLSSSWKIVSVAIKDKDRRMDMNIEFQHDGTFCCPLCGCSSRPVDSCAETWLHRNFFRFNAFLHAHVPRVECPKGCGVNKVEVPWSRPGTNFVLL